MPLLDLHHVAIKSKNLEETVAFYKDVLGMRQVERPEFAFPGAWLEMGDTMFHIYGGDAAKTHNGNYRYSQRVSPVDHIALRATGFDAMKEGLHQKALQLAPDGGAGLQALAAFRDGPVGRSHRAQF